MLIKKSNGETICESDSVDLSDYDLRDADFRGVTLDGIVMIGTDLRGVDFSDAELYEVVFYTANCEGCVFRNARISGVSLDGACLRGADFAGALFQRDSLLLSSTILGADLTDALLDKATFAHCQYDKHTMFPTGFDPRLRGLELV